MNKIYWYLCGYYRAEITGAALDQFLNRLTKHRVAFWNVEKMGDFRMTINIFFRDADLLREAAERSLCEYTLCRAGGMKQYIFRAVRRPFLWVGVMLTFLAVFCGQRFLLFYEVVGQKDVPEEAVMQALDEVGIGVGTYGPNIEPKRIKDRVLSVLPQLQWITVTQHGCKAQVVVRERETVPKTEKTGYANIVSSKDAIITEQSVLRGQALCTVGDAVLEGELLVSGIVDLEKVFSVVRAKAEIYGTTQYRFDVVMPQFLETKINYEKPKQSVWLEIGDHRIKIFGNSRILHTSCDKIVHKKMLSLPGGLSLPVTLVTEVYVPFEHVPIKISKDDAAIASQEHALHAVQKKMIAGKVMTLDSTIEEGIGVYCTTVCMQCREMIAKTVEGKWNKEDFLND